MPVQKGTIRGPYHGIITDLPPATDNQGFEDLVNVYGWKGRLRTRPGLEMGTSFFPPGGEVPLNMGSFQDAEGFLHTFLLSDRNPYMLTFNQILNLLTYPIFIGSLVLNAPGIGYTVGDELGVDQIGAQDGTATVLQVDGTGVILEIQLDNPGEGYTTAMGVPTTGGTGTGATVDIVQGTITSLGGTGLPYGVVKAQNRVYFCNGSIRLAFLDGEVGFKIAGNVPGACRFLTANENHLIGAYWSEPDPSQGASTTFPQRIRWSDSNNFEEWDTALPQFTSGVVDLINVPDNITGLSTIGTNTNVYRTNGISKMIPTGQASIPFFIPNFSISPKGEGSPYPYSLTTHNNIDRFIGNSDVWSFDGTGFQPLMEEKCNAKFFSDLNGATGRLQVRGFITVVLDNGFPYLGYVITIPGTNVSWILNINEQSWARMSWSTPIGRTTGFYDLQFIEQVYLS